MTEVIRAITSDTWETETAKIDSLGRHMPMTEFLDDFGENLCAAVRTHLSSKFIPEKPVNPDWIREISVLHRTLKPAQLRTVCCLMAGYTKHGHRGLFLDGEPGTGKTTVGVALGWLLHRFAGARYMLVVTPPHLTKKWAREVKTMLPGRADTLILDGGQDMHNLQGLLAEPRRRKPIFVIASSVRIRMGWKWRPACDYRISPVNKELFASCPSCGSYMTMGNTDSLLGCISRAGLQKTAPKMFGGDGRIIAPCPAGAPAAYAAFQSPSVCPHCKNPLWTEKRETGRLSRRERTVRALRVAFMEDWQIDRLFERTDWLSVYADLVADTRAAVKRLTTAGMRYPYFMSLGDYARMKELLLRETYSLPHFIKRKMRKFFDLCFIDECHEFKNDSARGAAALRIASQAKRVLAATGTMIGGYADDLPMLLSLADPSALQKRGYEVGVESPRGFNALYGAHRTRQVFSTDSSLMRAKSSVLRQPGLSPRAALELITPRCAYMKMSEINKRAQADMEIVAVDMGRELKGAYQRIEKDAINYLQTHSARIGAGVVKALLTYTTTCWMPQKIENPDTGNVLFYAPAIYGGENQKTPKEQKVLDLCLAEVAEGRKVLLYSEHVKERPQVDRYVEMLRRHHLAARSLDASKIRANRREAWLEMYTGATDVLVVNPEAVKTGLDLLDFRTMIFPEISLNPYTVAQAMSRASRATQNKQVRIYFISYKDCWEAKMAYLLAKKLQTMGSFAGEVPQTGYDEMVGNPYLELVANIRRLSGEGG